MQRVNTRSRKLFIETVVTGLVVLGLAWVLLNIVCSIALFVLTIVAQFFRDPDGDMDQWK